MSRHVVLCPGCLQLIDFEWKGEQPAEKVVCGICKMPFNIEDAERYFDLARSGVNFTDEEFMNYFNVQLPNPKTEGREGILSYVFLCSVWFVIGLIIGLAV